MIFRFGPVQWFDALPSTSTRLADACRGPVPPAPGAVAATARQTDGRGRQGRAWVGGESELALSFVAACPEDRRRAPSLAQAMALGTHDLLAGHGLAAQVKWPNDVLAHGRKIAGILVEAPAGNPPRLVAGIGLNLNLTAKALLAATSAGPAGYEATSVARERDEGRAPGVAAGRLCPRQWAERLLAALAPWVGLWTDGGFAPLRPAWEARVAGVGLPLPRSPDLALAGFGEWGEALVRPAGAGAGRASEPFWG